MTIVHVVLPNDIDDPFSPSGGNVYDRRLCDGLAAAGWVVREHAVAGAWPAPSAVERTAFGEVLAGLPDDSLVVVDGLIASVVPLAPQAARLRLVVLLHLPVGDRAEAAALRAALGERAATVPVSSTKSVHGQALEASGLLELVVTILALRAGALPVNAGYLEPDPHCPLDVVTAPRTARPAYALSLNSAFGGANTALLVRA